MQYSSHLLRHWRAIIGMNIHTIRTQKKVPLRKLARLTALPEYLLDQYELGKNEISLMHLVQIACGLGVSLEALVNQ